MSFSFLNKILHISRPFNNNNIVVLKKLNYCIPASIMSQKRRNLCNNNQNSEKRIVTVQELKENLAKAMGIEHGYKPVPASRAHLQEYLPKSQSELPPRSMKDSFMKALIPLSTDTKLQDKYITFLGHVRVGRLLEDMDIFAVMVAEKHIKNSKMEGKQFPYTLVTVLVDKIDFSDYVPKSHEDIRMSGHVSWVGKSSIEVVVWLEQQSYGVWRKLTRALFLMAARDPTNNKAAFINPLVPASTREKEILAGGEARKKRRIMLQNQHLTRVIPNAEEQKIIHDLFVRTVNTNEVSLKMRELPPGCVWMENCTLSNLVFSHPEDRNLHNTVFGGFIMRQATELSWALGYLFSKYRPVIKSISDISFNKPVQVNSLLRMHAYVVFSQMQYFQITVYAETWDSSSGKSSTTNSFHFTFEVPELVPEVIPSTYHEAMMYLDGRRHFFNVIHDHGKDNFDSIGQSFSLDSKL